MGGVGGAGGVGGRVEGGGTGVSTSAMTTVFPLQPVPILTVVLMKAMFILHNGENLQYFNIKLSKHHFHQRKLIMTRIKGGGRRGLKHLYLNMMGFFTLVSNMFGL